MQCAAPPDNKLSWGGRGASLTDAVSESHQNSTEIEAGLSGMLLSIKEPLGRVVHITKY